MARPHRRALVATALGAFVLGACARDDGDAATRVALAEQLVAAAHASGVASRLTVDAAEALYGAEAPAVCGAFDGGLSTAARTVLLGNLRQGRRKTITDGAVTYGRLVVETYCPQHLERYDDVVGALDPIERAAS